MANSPDLFQPFNAFRNVCPISNFYPVGQQTVLLNNWDDFLNGAVSQDVNCKRCCSSTGYCVLGSEHCAAPTCLFDYGIPCDRTKQYSGLTISDMDRSHVGNVPYGKKIFHCTVKGTVALTYDDGPCEWSSDLLDILKKNNVKATFFVVGWRICNGQKHHFPTEYASIIKRIYAEGHQIASHTWSHRSMEHRPTAERIDDMVKLELALSDILGVVPTYWRPPFGECRKEECQSDMGVLGYHTILWDVDTKDWAGNYTFAKDRFISHISQNHSSESSALTCMHETHNRTVHELTQFMIDRSREQGYRLVRLGECLNDPEQNWYRYPSSMARPTPYLD